jgi:hypothetical protein
MLKLSIKLQPKAVGKQTQIGLCVDTGERQMSKTWCLASESPQHKDRPREKNGSTKCDLDISTDILGMLVGSAQAQISYRRPNPN